MSSLRRSIRRATARRNGVKWPVRDNGQIIEGTVEGRTQGARVFDYEFQWGRDPNPNRYALTMMVHFRHPTKKRTAGRKCRARFIQPATMVASRYGLGAIAHV